MTAPPSVREMDERIAEVRMKKESAIDPQDFERAAGLRRVADDRQATRCSATPLLLGHRFPFRSEDPMCTRYLSVSDLVDVISTPAENLTPLAGANCQGFGRALADIQQDLDRLSVAEFAKGYGIKLGAES